MVARGRLENDRLTGVQEKRVWVALPSPRLNKAVSIQRTVWMAIYQANRSPRYWYAFIGLNESITRCPSQVALMLGSTRAGPHNGILGGDHKLEKNVAWKDHHIATTPHG